MRRYHVTTFGCQMNAHDSERIKGMLEELGLGEAVAQEEADVIVFNTCTIREKPDQRFAAHLAQARALKERDPERDHRRRRLLRRGAARRAVRSVSVRGRRVRAGVDRASRRLARRRGRERGPRDFGRSGDHFAAGLPARRERRFQAWVQISMGCNSSAARTASSRRPGPRASRPAGRDRRRGQSSARRRGT